MLIALRGLPASEVDALIVNERNCDISPLTQNLSIFLFCLTRIVRRERNGLGTVENRQNSQLGNESDR